MAISPPVGTPSRHGSRHRFRKTSSFQGIARGTGNEERGIWQWRFWEHRILDEDDSQQPIDDVHYNPIKHGHVSRLVDWPYSSFHRDVKAGLYPPHWAADDVVKELALE